MNRDGGGKPSRAGRQITAEEAELWHQLSHSVEKVKVKPRVAQGADTAGADPSSGPGPRAKAKLPAKPASPRAAPAAPPPPLSRPPPPADFDRRTMRQVSGGKVPIDASLDLHGLTQDAAHSRLRGFLVSSQAKGHRMVLIITGKGAGAGRHDESSLSGDSRRGVLRRSVPLWLEERDMRAIVLSYASAGVRHGGDGALYIRLRKARQA